MGHMKLADICVTGLQRIPVKGGDVLHAMKKCDFGYAGFGEAYFSGVATGVVKGWKRHKRMTMNLVVPVGRVRFVFYGLDDHGIAGFRVEEIGEERYGRLTVPPGIWFAFQGLAAPQNLVLNIGSVEHDPNEVERLGINDFQYAWS